MGAQGKLLHRVRGLANARGSVEMADVLRRAIVDGTLPAGTPLRQAEVAELFGVSRTPAREALHKLNAWGLVDMVVNQAAVVTDAHRTHYTGAFVVWAELEWLAVELAAPHAKRLGPVLVDAVAEEAAVVEAVTGCKAPARGAGQRRERWARAHAAFHDAILGASGSARLRESLEATTARLTRQALWDALAERPYPLQQSLQQHEEIATLMGDDLPSAACKAIHAHILGLGDAFLRRWDWKAAQGALS
jgi:DNA-binding GntR family transcriptional regulator